MARIGQPVNTNWSSTAEEDPGQGSDMGTSSTLDGENPKVLIVDDHDVALGSLGGILGEPDPFPELPLAPQGTNLKWINDPQVARQFLRTIANHQWRPDYILVDYEFVGSRHTGLCVVAAAREFSPTSVLSVFSGHSSNGGRALFTAAAYRWFDVQYDVDKSRTRRDLQALLSSDAASWPVFNHRLRSNAHLIDGLFGNRRQAGILLNWMATNGSPKLIAGLTFESTSNVDRAIRPLAESVKRFVEAFTTDDVPDLTRKGAGQELIRSFAVHNADFLCDPVLPEILIAKFQQR